jgi:two-component sensor histidine kinase
MNAMGRAVSLDDVFLSDELARRAPARPDHLREKLAVYDLASLMADRPELLLPRFVEIAMELTGGVSAGLSLYEAEPKPGVFRWHHLRGTLAPFEGATTPRGFSPCGITLDRNAPVLAVHAERYYDWIAAAKIEVPEVLLVPLRADQGALLGTLWIVADRVGHFDSGHARAMTELASFITLAIRIGNAEARLQRALAEQQVLSNEMSHRLKNLIAIADGMVWMTASGAETPDDMAATLSGRLQALARANALVRRGALPAPGPSADTTDLQEVLQTVLRPHDEARPGRPSRFTLSGPPVRCDDRSVNGIAMIFHELATNALKYGALSQPAGRVEIDWVTLPEAVGLRWCETGGPRVEAPPDTEGFGSALMRETVESQFAGTFERDWREDGLVVTMTLTLEALCEQPAPAGTA